LHTSYPGVSTVCSILFHVVSVSSAVNRNSSHCQGQHKHDLLTNPLIATLKSQSNGPLYSNTVIGLLVADGWAVTFVHRGRAWGLLLYNTPLLCGFNVPIKG